MFDLSLWIRVERCVCGWSSWLSTSLSTMVCGHVLFSHSFYPYMSLFKQSRVAELIFTFTPPITVNQLMALGASAYINSTRPTYFLKMI